MMAINSPIVTRPCCARNRRAFDAHQSANFHSRDITRSHFFQPGVNKMKAVHIALMVAAGLCVSSQVMADEALAKAKNCMSCHAIDKKLVGPAYKDVAAKYKGDAGAVDKLAAKIKAGGKGVWGEIPMPPNNVTPDEAKKLATWVLSQK
jgi:cytochrome c